MYKCEHYTDSIYYQLEQTAKYCKYLGMQIFQKLDLPISLDEFVILDILIDNEEICQRDLAKLILKDRPCTGRLLNSLEEKGFIESPQAYQSESKVYAYHPRSNGCAQAAGIH